MRTHTPLEPVNGGEFVAEALGAHGVSAVFTLCGGHISPILVAAKRRGMRVVDVRDEASAVFAADAVARLTGTPGVAVVTAGPGATNTITAVTNASLAESPVVLIGGAPPTILRGRGALQDIDHQALFRPHVKHAVRVERVRDLAAAVGQAFAVARRGTPGPTYVECAADLLYGESDVRRLYGVAGERTATTLSARIERWVLERHLARLFAPGDASPEPGLSMEAPAAPERLVQRVTHALRVAQRPVLILGSQAVRLVSAIPQLVGAVERLGVPVYVNGTARGLLPPGHPLLYRHRRTAALKQADLVILAGVPLDFRLDYGRQIGRGTRIVAVSLGATAIRRNRRPAHGAVCEPARFVIALAHHVSDGASRTTAWCDALRSRDNERDREITAFAARPTEGVNPVALCRAIDRALPDDSIIVADGGDFVGTAAYTVSPRRPLSWLDPGPFGTLGAGGGFALGAAVARPGAEVWILYGDGAAAFSIAEFDTFVRHGLSVIAVVGNDGSWAQIARGQQEMLGDDVATVLRRTAYDQVAEGYGGVGFELSDPTCMEAVLADARAAARDGKPVLVNALIGPSEFRAGSIAL